MELARRKDFQGTAVAKKYAGSPIIDYQLIINKIVIINNKIKIVIIQCNRLVG
jgi:hypothetical protein